MKQFIQAVLLATLIAAPARVEAQLKLELNIPEQRLHVYQGESRIRTYLVSVGEPGHDTPHGEYEIHSAEWNPSWRPPNSEWAKDRVPMTPGPKNPMGRVKLFFMPLYFIHGTPEEDKIGTPASKGCVRLRNRDIVELARLIHVEAAPHITSDAIDRILAKSSETRAVRFKKGIPLTIRYEPYVVEGDSVTLYPNIYERKGMHTEGVRQALLRAGYDERQASSEEIRRFLDRVAKTTKPEAVALRSYFPMLGVREVKAEVSAPRITPVAPKVKMQAARAGRL